MTPKPSSKPFVFCRFEEVPRLPCRAICDTVEWIRVQGLGQGVNPTEVDLAGWLCVCQRGHRFVAVEPWPPGPEVSA